MTKNIAASVRQKLLNISRERKQRFNELLLRYALERWLYRLSQSRYSEKFVLKGAMMLTAWQIPTTRPTRDIDMLAQISNDLDAVLGVIIEINQTETEPDGLIFDTENIITERIAEDALYEGVRARFRGNLDSARLDMQIDIGFSDIVTPGPVDMTFPTILDQPAPQLNAYNPETAIAEKFEAMVKLGELNSRMKDFYDIWALSQFHSFTKSLLDKAVRSTFRRRDTELDTNASCFSKEYGTSENKQKQWQAFLKRSQLNEVAPANFEDVWKATIKFLEPIIHPQEDELKWEAGGPWK
ncbi:hypothetical protein Pla110_23680 [Polystyrenella longa]|uniref:Nucleotidyl transferase AbiEii toxin, Type IV TA system n=1 Tax=Polystyrenella longa TaxID=2528007 RepID=A0A518CN34_9PLAN|nr:nucleotidyl transferase AbiEii/AbiGii toxin family protein [Polystyrenella longa]QDU80637.1 hypothetical protein Pla110_23680 [Polystyrenella longa]